MQEDHQEIRMPKQEEINYISEIIKSCNHRRKETTSI